jgi:transglutaminase-like putative cysteine protease
MRLKISHVTRYEFDHPVDYALQQIRLTPKSRAGQTVLSWNIRLDNAVRQCEFEDQNNNTVTLASISAGARHLEIACEGEIENTNATGIVGAHGGYAPLWYFRRATALTRPGPHLRKLAKDASATGGGELERLHELSRRIGEQVRYETGRTLSDTAAEHALEAGHGVCQDHAHIFVAAARLMGFPARYVSGYFMLTDRVDQDAAHAWAEAHVADLGWVGFDISNKVSPDLRHIRVATGLDYSEAAPVAGVRFGHGAESMIVSLAVEQ